MGLAALVACPAKLVAAQAVTPLSEVNHPAVRGKLAKVVVGG